MALETLADARREELTRLVMAAKPTPFWLDRPDAPPARAGRWPGPTATPAAGTCGSGRWTRPAWASTPDVFSSVAAAL